MWRRLQTVLSIYASYLNTQRIPQLPRYLQKTPFRLKLHNVFVQTLNPRNNNPELSEKISSAAAMPVNSLLSPFVTAAHAAGHITPVAPL